MASKSGQYPTLFEPYRFKQLTLKNRMVKAAYSSTNSDDRGYITESAVAHYDAVARGGIGLFITESVAVHRLGMTGTPRMAIWDDSYIPGQKALVEVVHKYGTPIIIQLQHAGPAYSTGTYGAWSVEGLVGKAEPTAPSTLTHEQMPSKRANTPRGLTVEEIKEIEQAFVDAAVRAAEAGYDGVQLHGATGYLLNSFFSRAWNKRSDQYGGRLENRARLCCDIIRGIRSRLGEKFIISVRFNGLEIGARYDDGITLEEGRAIGQLLEQAGADLLDVTAYGYNHFEWVLFPEQMLYPEAPAYAATLAKAVRENVPLVDVAWNVKQGVKIPVIAVGKLSFETGEQVLREGKADLVAYARALIADPDAPNKLKAGQLQDVRPCTHCMTCLDTFLRSEHERCRVNAAFGKESEFQVIPAAKRRHVLVVGGGPGGMEAARVAAERGHQVTLCEQQAGLGGLVPLASLIKGTDVEDLPPYVEYLETQLGKLGVEVKRNQRVDAQFVRKISPDAVILATGSKLKLPEIPGMDSKIVVTNTILMDKVRLPKRIFGTAFLEKATKVWLPLGKRVFIVGGLMQGAELAEFLAKRGRKVVMSDTSAQLGTGILEMHRSRLLEWLGEKGAELLAQVKYERITDDGVHLITSSGESRFYAADTVVVLGNREADLSLRDELVGVVPDLHVIGDCSAPGMIVDAVEGGFRAAMAI